MTVVKKTKDDPEKDKGELMLNNMDALEVIGFISQIAVKSNDIIILVERSPHLLPVNEDKFTVPLMLIG